LPTLPDADFSNPGAVADIAQRALEDLQEIGRWRQVVFQGTNYPAVNPAEPNGKEVVPRNEWLAWKNAIKLDGKSPGHSSLAITVQIVLSSILASNQVEYPYGIIGMPHGELVGRSRCSAMERLMLLCRTCVSVFWRADNSQADSSHRRTTTFLEPQKDGMGRATDPLGARSIPRTISLAS